MAKRVWKKKPDVPKSRARELFGRAAALFNGARFTSPSYRTAKPANINRFGTQFLATFNPIELKAKKGKKFVIAKTEADLESPVAIALLEIPANADFSKMDPINARYSAIAKLALGFKKNAVIIEIIQGGRHQVSLERFREMHGAPWANFILRQVEKHAARSGFRAVQIRTPESQVYYHNPEFYPHWKIISEPSRKEIRGKIAELQQRMRNLYYGVANAEGYKRKGIFFVKPMPQTSKLSAGRAARQKK